MIKRYLAGLPCAVCALLMMTTMPVSSAVIKLDYATLSADYGITSIFKGKNLETVLNDRVFNPIGIEFEVALHTGATTAVDDFSIEGPGLTVIGGAGFILRFDQDVSEVRVRFGNHKDNGARSLYAFDPAIDFTRGPAPGSQHSDGNFTGWSVPLSSREHVVNGIVKSTEPLDLTVSSSSGNISSIWADTNFFLTSLEEIEVNVSSTGVSEPPVILLMVLGLIALRRSTRAA